MCRSVCSVELETYRGALVMDRGVLYCGRWVMNTLEMYVVSLPTQVKVTHFCFGVSRSVSAVHFFVGFGVFCCWTE